jgi:hypothetical protein
MLDTGGKNVGPSMQPSGCGIVIGLASARNRQILKGKSANSADERLFWVHLVNRRNPMVFSAQDKIWQLAMPVLTVAVPATGR